MTQAGAPSSLKLVAKTLSPSWITMSKDHKFLYAVNEIASYGPNKSGSITAYAVDGASGALKQFNVVDSGGSIPCYVSIHPSGKFLLVANYTGGSYSVTRIKPDGSLGETTDIVKPSGPMGVYQAADRPTGMFGSKEPHGSRGHMILPDPSGQYVVGADAGRDQIFVWKLDTGTGKLNQVSVTKTIPGFAPRHFAFSPDGKTLYQQGEQNSRLQVYGFADGKLTAKGPSISTLPAGFQGGNTTSELLIDKAGKHLYGANRNHDSIATMAVQGGRQRQADRQHPYRRQHPAQPDHRSQRQVPLFAEPGGRQSHHLPHGRGWGAEVHRQVLRRRRAGGDGIPAVSEKRVTEQTRPDRRCVGGDAWRRVRRQCRARLYRHLYPEPGGPHRLRQWQWRGHLSGERG